MVSEVALLKSVVSQEKYCEVIKTINFNFKDQFSECKLCQLQSIFRDGNCTECLLTQISSQREKCVDCLNVVIENMCVELPKIPKELYKLTIILTKELSEMDIRRKYSAAFIMQSNGSDLIDCLTRAVGEAIIIDPELNKSNVEYKHEFNRVGDTWCFNDVSKLRSSLVLVSYEKFFDWLKKQKSGNYKVFSGKIRPNLRITMDDAEGLIGADRVLFISPTPRQVKVYNDQHLLFERSVENEWWLLVDSAPQQGLYVQITLDMLHFDTKTLISVLYDGEEVFYGEVQKTRVLNLVLNEKHEPLPKADKSETIGSRTVQLELRLSKKQVKLAKEGFKTKVPVPIQIYNLTVLNDDSPDEDKYQLKSGVNARRLNRKHIKQTKTN